jgi:hypothetical protein
MDPVSALPTAPVPHCNPPAAPQDSVMADIEKFVNGTISDLAPSSSFVLRVDTLSAGVELRRATTRDGARVTLRSAPERRAAARSLRPGLAARLLPPAKRRQPQTVRL